MRSEEQKSQIKMSMNDKWHLVKLTHAWPDGHLINQMAHALIERNTELLSLREAKPYGYVSSLCERDLLKGHSCPLYPSPDEDEGYTIPLFTTTKPVPDQKALRDYIRSYGYTTNGQSDELAVAILALLNGEDADDDNY